MDGFPKLLITIWTDTVVVDTIIDVQRDISRGIITDYYISNTSKNSYRKSERLNNDVTLIKLNNDAR